MRKLKFQYLEQKAKDQYIKTIVSDEAPNINADDNESIRAENEKNKAALKELKEHLAEKCDDIQKLAPLVEEGRSTTSHDLSASLTPYPLRLQESEIIHK